MKTNFPVNISEESITLPKLPPNRIIEEGIGYILTLLQQDIPRQEYLARVDAFTQAYLKDYQASVIAVLYPDFHTNH